MTNPNQDSQKETNRIEIRQLNVKIQSRDERIKRLLKLLSDHGISEDGFLEDSIKIRSNNIENLME
jgi:hypothetical protein